MSGKFTAAGGLLSAAALAIAVSACGGGGAPASSGGTAATGAAGKGGTLTILSNQDFSHLDPARNWTMPHMDFGIRLLYRTLTTFKAEPGAGGTRIVPDLATDLGTPSQGGKVWTFTLKSGLKYEDGTPIVADDVKYNVERSFAPELPGGPNYAQLYLADAEGYKGPLKGERLKSIETPDEKTIVFRLKRPVAEFSYTVTLPTFAPVPKTKEAGEQYDNRPFSSGPYKIQSYDRGKELVLVRNANWDPATDPVRKAYPDKIVMKQGLRQSVIDDRLIDSRGEDATAVTYSDVTAASLAKVLPRPEVKARMVGEISGCTDMIGFNTAKAPFDDPRMRQAVHFALDKQALQTAQGGPDMAEIATSYLPPALSGGRAQDVYGLPPTGDVEKAKALLGGRTLDVAMTVSTGEKSLGEAVQSSLKRAGINVTLNPVDPSVYYDTIGDTAKSPEMFTYGWCPDYPSGATFLPMLFDGRTIVEKGNSGNVWQFKDKAVEARIDEIQAMTDTGAAATAWAELDRRIMRSSPAVPTLWDKKPLLVGTGVTGAFGHPVWSGQLDFSALGVKQG
ncbi:ABC transporter substrate-binding protein [Sphaerisporangium krabiense]|uniref:Peptide/nickel transport system substrate-binding protein n=1 Tax=Sphaerisporangium krabiense TaxID=763782 RepID=A0A7W8ZAV1_9ACTN|nr:ABC transporter substrate-binding protein [Sphaerisporangium krabiense]MBB5630657.1 peptide/nickel transport system substrate-binding protein [Sphaerisporangium krabiense]